MSLELMISARDLGPRGPVVSGKISVALYESAKALIDGETYRTMNDVVEDAILNLVQSKNASAVNGGAQIAV